MIFGQKVDQDWLSRPYRGYVLWPLLKLSQFLDLFGWNIPLFHGNSRIYYLSIGNDFDFLGHFWRENGRGHHARSYVSWAPKPNQKVGPLKNLLSQPLSRKSIFESFRPGPSLNLYWSWIMNCYALYQYWILACIEYETTHVALPDKLSFKNTLGLYWKIKALSCVIFMKVLPRTKNDRC